jgi:hypothetical protein
MFGIARDTKLMGEFVAGKRALALYGVIITIVAVCVAAQFWFIFNL